MDGAAVSNIGPSGGGLTCLPTYHSLMPIDEWTLSGCLGMRKGCRLGNWDSKSCSNTEPESLLLDAAGEGGATVKSCEGRREFGSSVCGKIYIKKSLASLKP